MFREEFKFFTEMEEIFRKELKVEDLVTDTSVPDESEDCAPEPVQRKGEAIYLLGAVYIPVCGLFSFLIISNMPYILICELYSLSCLKQPVGGWQHEAGLERRWDWGSPGRLGERRHSEQLEGQHQKQTYLHPDFSGHGQPGLPAYTWTMSDQDKKAEGQFQTLPRRQKVSAGVWFPGGRMVKV